MTEFLIGLAAFLIVGYVAYRLGIFRKAEEYIQSKWPGPQ